MTGLLKPKSSEIDIFFSLFRMLILVVYLGHEEFFIG